MTFMDPLISGGNVARQQTPQPGPEVFEFKVDGAEQELLAWKLQAKGQELARFKPQLDAIKPILDRTRKLNADMLACYAGLGLTRPSQFRGYDEARKVIIFEAVEDDSKVDGQVSQPRTTKMVQLEKEASKEVTPPGDAPPSSSAPQLEHAVQGVDAKKEGTS